MPPARAAWGELSVFETWAPPLCCGSWLRPKLLPPIGSSLGRMLVWFLLLCPSTFWSLWAGNQVTGVTGDGGTGSAGIWWGSITRRIEWLTRRQVPFAAEATGSVSDRYPQFASVRRAGGEAGYTAVGGGDLGDQAKARSVGRAAVRLQ